MKLKHATTTRTDKPAFDVDEWKVVFETKEKRIVGIKVTLRGVTKKVAVRNDNIKAAFQRVEKYFKLKY
jgi:hypothetical protein